MERREKEKSIRKSKIFLPCFRSSPLSFLLSLFFPPSDYCFSSQSLHLSLHLSLPFFLCSKVWTKGFTHCGLAVYHWGIPPAPPLVTSGLKIRWGHVHFWRRVREPFPSLLLLFSLFPSVQRALAFKPPELKPGRHLLKTTHRKTLASQEPFLFPKNDMWKRYF